MPNIAYLSKETGFGISTCQKALRYLESENWLIKNKARCDDGSVRNSFTSTNKLDDMMIKINNLKHNHAKNNFVKNDKNALKSNQSDPVKTIQSDPVKTIQSDPVKTIQSYIKENNIKENNNFNILESGNVSNVIFDEKPNKETQEFIFNLAQKENLNSTELFMNLIDLKKSDLYKNQNVLITDAVVMTRRTQNNDQKLLPTNDNINFRRAIVKSELERRDNLTAVQQITVYMMLMDLKSQSKIQITNINEVFSWIEFQIINEEHHFKGKNFKNCINIIRKMLCNHGSRQYSKPLGYQEFQNKNKTEYNKYKISA